VKSVIVAGALALAAAHVAVAQDSSALRLRLSLADAVEVGHRAPLIVLPYAIADSAGPASQPFNLAKELGNVVVLVFYAPTATTADDWRAIAAHLQSRLTQGVVVAGVSSLRVADEVAFAHAIASPFKFLSDEGSTVARRYGAVTGRGSRGMTLVLVDRDGVVRRVEISFTPRAAKAFVGLDAAMAAALRR
jgi:peroxiredoxin